MFYTEKQKLIASLEHLQRTKLCGYHGMAFCDCKYGYGDRQQTVGTSEQTGCPEVRSCVELLSVMTEK